MRTVVSISDVELVKQYWSKLEARQRPVLAFGFGVALSVAVLPLLTMAMNASFYLWAGLLLLAAVVLGQLIRSTAKAVTARFGFLAAFFTLLCGLGSALFGSCSVVGGALAIASCLMGGFRISILLVAVCVVSASIAFVFGFYRFSANELLECAKSQR